MPKTHSLEGTEVAASRLALLSQKHIIFQFSLSSSLSAITLGHYPQIELKNFELDCCFFMCLEGILKKKKKKNPLLLYIIPTREPELYPSSAPGNWQLRQRLNKSSHSLSKYLLIICHVLKAMLSAGVREEKETSASVLVGHPGSWERTTWPLKVW